MRLQQIIVVVPLWAANSYLAHQCVILLLAQVAEEVFFGQLVPVPAITRETHFGRTYPESYIGCLEFLSSGIAVTLKNS
jgi:hypothetical protein